jgi:hypothetical protein
MYRNVYSLIDGKYTDTDSCLTTLSEELRLREMRPELFQTTPMDIDGNSYNIKDFGTLDCEFDRKKNANEAILLQPKNYLVGNRETAYFPKIKCKGVTFKSDACRYVPFGPLQNQTNNILFGKCQEASLKSDPIRLFDTILAQG